MPATKGLREQAEQYEVLNLDRQLRDGRAVQQMDKVLVLGPADALLQVTVSRPGGNRGPDVTQHPARLDLWGELLLPQQWLSSGADVMVERG
jgi:hypothetical protein